MVWDVTCPDTLAPSHLNRAVTGPGAVASFAEVHKRLKYDEISKTHVLNPIAVKSMGLLAKTGWHSWGNWEFESLNWIELNFIINRYPCTKIYLYKTVWTLRTIRTIQIRIWIRTINVCVERTTFIRVLDAVLPSNVETLRVFSEQCLMHQIWLIFFTYSQLTFL